jgi:hypothetical protein
MKCSGKKIVAQQHTGFYIPATVNRRHVASDVCVIDDIVMHQSRSMNHFDHRCQGMCLTLKVAGKTDNSGSEHHKDRPNAFSLIFGDVVADVLDEFAGVTKLSHQNVVDRSQIAAGKLIQPLA